MKTNCFIGFLKGKLSFLYVAVLLLFFTSGVATAQMMDDVGSSDMGGAEAPFRYGAVLGAGFNQFTQPGTLIGINVGAMGRYQVLDFMDLQAELIYTTQGGGRADYSRDVSDLGAEITAVSYFNRSVIFQNVELPVSARLTMNSYTASEIVPRLVAGGSIAYNVAAFEVHDKFYVLADGRPVAITNKQENVGNEYEDLQLSLHAGIAIDYKLPGGNLFTTEIRYRQGMVNVNAVTDIPDQRGVLFTNSLSFNFLFAF